MLPHRQVRRTLPLAAERIRRFPGNYTDPRFLDGRVVTQYGYLSFGTNPDEIYFDHLGHTFFDIFTIAPVLARYTLCPRLPFDPLRAISTHAPVIPTVEDF